ncbi:alpha/beta hydrolase family protein [Rhodococcus sp. IEGM 1408]|uniref:alpha/beta hydrolase n=1 Tax=Rhodococcus sp. IEGM 1408 TaxID=3082220 RepID=UPI002954ECE4|nr:alpha/beta hydrolase family protein [Rhodococcus sp. IEGM 1408]MDV8001604.1 alpha/beta hydrolase family protein [Rhodococcus sp. IEGM 1408]
MIVNPVPPAPRTRRPSRLRRASRASRAVLGVATAAALAVGLTPASAQAQGLPASISPEQISNGALGAISPESLSQLLYFGNLPGSSGSSMMGLANRFGFSPNMFAGSAPPAPQPNPNITVTKVVGKKIDGRYEQWLIDSADMKRGITVEVYRATRPDAPFLYLLDGVGSELPSGFMQWGAAEQFADQNVNLIIPTGGQGSMWADWNAQDPVLGISKWESFITRDLPRLVEPQVSTSTKRGVGGISMGAGAALTLATRHPELYRAVFGVSGCYSTDTLGQILTRYTVESRGATLTNMWGEPGNAQWASHDAMINAEKLRGKAIYLSSGTGVANPGDWAEYNNDAANFVAGMALEQATGQCTRAADRRLRELNIPARVDHLPTGMHNWSYYSQQIPVAWNAVRAALQ